MLKELAHLIEQHDKNALGIFPDAERAHRGQRHKEIFIEDLTP